MKIGRWLRAWSARSTMPLPSIGSDEAVHVTTMSIVQPLAERALSLMTFALKRLASGSARSACGWRP